MPLQLSTEVLAIFVIGSIWLSYLLNKILLRFSTNLGTRTSGEVRFASTAKPSIGGLSFYITFLLAFICSLFIYPEYLISYTRETAGLFAATTLGFLIGMVDDAYNTKPTLKFTGQFVCGMILVFSDIYIRIVPPGIPGSMTYNTLFTVFWVVGMMNSINMLDNMDAVATTTAISIIATVLFVIFYKQLNDVFFTLTIIAVAGSLIGFLFYNWHPSKMYMGDSGSQFLGVFLAILGSRFLWNYRSEGNEIIQIKQLLIPGLTFLMPVIDTATVFIRRMARGQSPFVGGTDHTTHHLAYLGIPVSWVAFIFGSIGMISILGVYLVLHVNNWTFVYSYIIIGYCLFVFLLMQLLYEFGGRKKPVERTDEGYDS